MNAWILLPVDRSCIRRSRFSLIWWCGSGAQSRVLFHSWIWCLISCLIWSCMLISWMWNWLWKCSMPFHFRIWFSRREEIKLFLICWSFGDNQPSWLLYHSALVDECPVLCFCKHGGMILLMDVQNELVINNKCSKIQTVVLWPVSCDELKRSVSERKEYLEGRNGAWSASGPEGLNREVSNALLNIGLFRMAAKILTVRIKE